jgi:deazaflavin-dependent oxidoreductase (nitroreductase family)
VTRHRLRERLLWVVKNTVNRVTTPLARSGHGPFSLIRHVGRTSGRTYETPLILARVPEGFIAELTYGERVNWYRNIVAAGGGIVVYRGDDYRITAIEPCSSDRGRNAYPTPFRQVLKAIGRKEFRLLHSDDSPHRP